MTPHAPEVSLSAVEREYLARNQAEHLCRLRLQQSSDRSSLQAPDEDLGAVDTRNPQQQATLTTGQNPAHEALTAIAPSDTTYIYTRTNQPTNIAWNTTTKTYQPAS